MKFIQQRMEFQPYIIIHRSHGLSRSKETDTEAHLFVENCENGGIVG